MRKFKRFHEELRCWRAEWLPNDCRRPESPAPDGLNLWSIVVRERVNKVRGWWREGRGPYISLTTNYRRLENRKFWKHPLTHLLPPSATCWTGLLWTCLVGYVRLWVCYMCVCLCDGEGGNVVSVPTMVCRNWSRSCRARAVAGVIQCSRCCTAAHQPAGLLDRKSRDHSKITVIYTTAHHVQVVSSKV